MEKVFTPTSKPNKAYSEITNNPAIPNYDSPGTSYKGYSMEKTSEGYKLNLQTPFQYIWTTGSMSSASETNMINYPAKGKTLYITQIILTLSIGTSVTSSYLSIKGQDEPEVFKTQFLRSGLFPITFSPPLKIISAYDPNTVPSGCVVKISSGAGGVINQCCYTLNGWFE